MDKDSIQALRERLAELDKERAAILQLLQIWGDKVDIGPSIPLTLRPRTTQSFSVSGRIIDATVELIHKLGRPVKNSEILEYVKEKQLTLGNADKPDRMLSAILANETKKKDARIKSAARGYWEIKQ